MVDAHLSPQDLRLDLMFIVYFDDHPMPRAYTQIFFGPIASLYPPTSPQAESLMIVGKRLGGKIHSYDSSCSPYIFASTQSGNYKAVIVVEDFPEPRS